MPASAHSMLENVGRAFFRGALIAHPAEANVLAAKPHTATCIIDGIAVTLMFFPDTGILRITDRTGARLKETRWPASWRTLVTTFRELGKTPANRTDPDKGRQDALQSITGLASDGCLRTSPPKAYHDQCRLCWAAASKELPS